MQRKAHSGEEAAGSFFAIWHQSMQRLLQLDECAGSPFTLSNGAVPKWIGGASSIPLRFRPLSRELEGAMIPRQGSASSATTKASSSCREKVRSLNSAVLRCTVVRDPLRIAEYFAHAESAIRRN